MPTKFLKFFSLLFILALSLPLSLYGQDKDETEAKSPLEITSEKMKTEDNGRKIIFIGNVHGTWEDVVLDSDILEIYTRPSEESDLPKTGPAQAGLGEGQELEKIIAIHNVDITKGTKKAKGDRAVYIEKSRKMTLTGTPNATAWDDKNELQGSEMVYFLDEDRLEVTKGVRVMLFPKKSSLSKKNEKQ